MMLTLFRVFWIHRNQSTKAECLSATFEVANTVSLTSSFSGESVFIKSMLHFRSANCIALSRSTKPNSLSSYWRLKYVGNPFSPL